MLEEVPARRQLRTRAAEVNDLGDGCIVNLEARMPDAEAEIGFFGVHEVLLVERPCTLDRFRSDEEEASGDSVYGSRTVKPSREPLAIQDRGAR